MKQGIKLHKKTYEQLHETAIDLANENYVLSKALDEACDLLGKSKAGTTCDEENRKSCMENHCFNTCIYARKMNKEEWRDYLMKGEKE